MHLATSGWPPLLGGGASAEEHAVLKRIFGREDEVARMVSKPERDQD